MNALGKDVVPAERADWFSTRGRRGRLSFLLNFLFVNLGVAVITAIAGPMDGLMAPLVVAGCSIVGGWVNICLTTQRLHDTGRSGWVQAVPFVAALLGLMLLAVDQPVVQALGIALVLAGCLGFMLWLFVARGSPGGNDFGPPPTAQS